MKTRASPARAATIIKTTDDNGEVIAWAILDLELDGELYNVDFVVGNFRDIYGRLNPNLDFDNGPAALAATAAIVAEFNGAVPGDITRVGLPG